MTNLIPPMASERKLRLVPVRRRDSIWGSRRKRVSEWERYLAWSVPRCDRYLPLAIACLSMFGVDAAHAIDLSWQPQIQLAMRASDNLRSTAVDEEAAWGFDTGGGAILNAESDTWRSTVTPAFNFRRFVIGEDADAEEYNVRTNTEWAFVERAAADLKFDYARDSTLTTETTDLGFRRNDIINRDTITLQPGVRYALNERTSLNAGLLYSDTTFEDRLGSGFVDYEYKQGNAGVRRIYNDSLTFVFSGYVSEFQTSPKETPIVNGVFTTDSRSVTYGGQGGVAYRHSDTLDSDFSVGYSLTTSDSHTLVRFDIPVVVFDPNTGLPQFVLEQIIDDHTSDSGLIASASIRKAYENLRARIDYRREVSPSSRGAQTVADDIVVVLDHDLSRRVAIGFRGGYRMQSTQGESNSATTNTLNRDQVMASGSVRYRVTEELTLNAAYRFFWNQLSNPDRSVYNNGLFVSLIYTGQPHYFRGY